MEIGKSNKFSAFWKNEAILRLYFALNKLPDWVLYRILAPAAATVTMCIPSVRRPVRHNMRHVLGVNSYPLLWPMKTWGVLLHNSISWVDHLVIPKLDLKKFRDRFSLEGLDNLIEAIASGRGVIMVGGHFSGYILVIQIMMVLGIRALCPTEPLANEALNAKVMQLRRSQGADCQTMGGATMKNVIRHLRSGGVVIWAVDRDITGKGVPLRFLGRETIMPIRAAQLAKREGHLLVVTTWERQGPSSFRGDLQPALKPEDFKTPEDLAQACLPPIEAQILRSPEKWLPIDRVWGGEDD